MRDELERRNNHPENHYIHTYVVKREWKPPFADFTLKFLCDLVVEEVRKSLAKQQVEHLEALLYEWLVNQSIASRLFQSV